MRVWIEIASPSVSACFPWVTLHVRVWIEIGTCTGAAAELPVTLHVRVWIEMIRKDGED